MKRKELLLFRSSFLFDIGRLLCYYNVVDPIIIFDSFFISAIKNNKVVKKPIASAGELLMKSPVGCDFIEEKREKEDR